MMDFARRLAPPRVTDATRAIAVLPSRFAGDSPRRLESTPAAVEEERAAPARPYAQGASARRVRRAAAAPHAETVEVAEPPRAAAVPPPPPRPGDAGEAARGPRPRPGPLVAELALRGDEPAAGVAAPSVGGGHEVGVSGDTRPRPVPRVDAAGAPTQPPMRRPLSDAALAARIADSATPRPIVQVTIDRIEVRAPAAAPASLPPARARPAPPSVSLGDYLRQRTAKPGGRA